MEGIEDAARDLRETNERLYGQPHEYREVDAQTFQHLDLGFYDRTRDALIALGCTWLADVEDVTIKGMAFDLRTFIRMMTSPEKTVAIGLFHPKPKWWIRLLLWVLRAKVGRTIDCETECSNGIYIVTSNAALAGKMNTPPGFDMQYFPANTDHLAVFQAHVERLQKYLAANPGVAATPLNNYEEALAMQHRMHAAKSAYRKSIGYATEEELRRMGATKKMAKEIKRELGGEE